MEKPNILFIMADQLIPFLTGAYGHPVVQTPHLDQLTRDGVRFDAAYSPCPVCGPARASLMTGQYVSTISAWDNAAPLRCDEPTFAHYLSLAGYDTVLAGKMHFVGPDQLHGFQRRFNTNIYPADFAWTPVRGAEHPSERSHALNYVGDGIKVGAWNQYLSYDEETHLRALEYLRAKGMATDDETPFFLCVSYHHPHEPFWPPQELWDLYDDADIDVPEFPGNLEETYSTLDTWLNVYHGIAKAPTLRDPVGIRRVRRAYYALVSYIDRKVGELLQTLQDSGLADETVIVFTSDHGDMLCERGMVQKRTFYEWSSRIPLLIRFPDGQYAGTIRPEPVNLIDLMPTFLDLAGVDEHLPVDGESLLSLLDEGGDSPRETFSEYHSQGSHAPCFMIRRGHHKYVYIHGHDSQLFDLDNDPGEWQNLAGDLDFASIEEDLHSRILARFDPDHIDKAIGISIRKRNIVKQAMTVNGTRWDVEPRFDPKRSINEQYLRRKP